MSLTLVSQPEYTIDTPGFAQHRFTNSSSDYMTLPDAVRFASERNAVLQSAAEAVAFRIAANGADNANEYQATRSAAISFHDGDQYCIAFDDSPDPEQNILLARPQAGYDAHRTSGKWLVPKHDPCITSALERAASSDRIIAVPEQNLVTLVTTIGPSGTSEYGNSKGIRALIGDLAEPYARFLAQRKYRQGRAWYLTSSTLQELGVGADTVEVRRLGVGGVDNVGDSYYLVAYVRCNCIGRARGVRKMSIGNKGGD